MKRTWQAERRAAVRWLRWRAEWEKSNGGGHEAAIIRQLARLIESGRHCAEGPPAPTHAVKQ
jgi:hypothetical protein